MILDEEKPEKILALPLDREIKQEIEEEKVEPEKDNNEESNGIQNSSESKKIDENVLKLENIDEDSEVFGVLQNPLDSGNSGDFEGFEQPRRKRVRIDAADSDLPAPTLQNCSLCQVPKEDHELRFVENEQESLPILIGWTLKGDDPKIDNQSIIVNKWICDRHWQQSVDYIYKHLRITCYTFLHMVMTKGSEIMRICGILGSQMTIVQLKEALYHFCRENQSEIWTKTSMYKLTATDDHNRPSSSSQSFNEPSPKPSGSQKRKSSEVKKTAGMYRCTVCCLSKSPEEMQEIDIVHENLVIMIRCVLADELSVLSAKKIMNVPGRKYLCHHHIGGTIREIYRNLGISSSRQILDTQFKPDMIIWRVAKVLQDGITFDELKEILTLFCHVNELREAHATFEIPYESVDIRRIQGTPSLPSGSSTTSSRTIWEEQEKPKTLPEVLEHSGSLLQESQLKQSHDLDISVIDQLKNNSTTAQCSICGETRPLLEMSPLNTKIDKLAILIIWIMDGGLSISEAQHFFNVDDQQQMICTHHAMFTVEKIYEHLSVNEAYGIFMCQMSAQNELVLTARLICPDFNSSLLIGPISKEHGLAQILNCFCKKYEAKEQEKRDDGQEVRPPPNTEPPPPEVCVICRFPKPAQQLRPFKNDDERFVQLTKCVLFDNFSLDRARTALQSSSLQSICHRHFQDTAKQIFTSLRVSKCAEILECSNERIFNWLEVGMMLRPDLQAGIFKKYLLSFCHSLTKTGQMGGNTMTEKQALPPPNLCVLCAQPNPKSCLRLTTKNSERQLLAIGWLLMEKWTTAQAIKFWKSKFPIGVCYDDFGRAIDRIFVELKINHRGELSMCTDGFKGRVMDVVHSLQPNLKMEVFRSFLVTWTTENTWSLDVWKLRNRESQCHCALCEDRVPINEIIRLKLRRDQLVMMMAWIRAKSYNFEKARAFLASQKYVCRAHLKEAAHIILEYLEIPSIDELPTVLNKPLATLLWYTQETGQRTKILLKDMLGMLREFFMEYAEIIDGEVLTVPVPAPISPPPSLFPVKAITPPDTCTLCNQKAQSPVVAKQPHAKLLLATGWVLMKQCELTEAKRIEKLPAVYSCQSHFGAILANILEYLGVKSQFDLPMCSQADKLKLVTYVNAINPPVSLSDFWRFLSFWNWENDKELASAVLPEEATRSSMKNLCEKCAFCHRIRVTNKLKVCRHQDRIIVMIACVLKHKIGPLDAKNCLKAEVPIYICYAHLASIIIVILESLKVQKIDDIMKVAKERTDVFNWTLNSICTSFRPSMPAFQGMMKEFYESNQNVIKQLQHKTPTRTPHPAAIQEAVICFVCQKGRRKSEIKFIATASHKLVLLTGCVLAGICSTEKAKPLLAPSIRCLPICSAHCSDAIEVIQTTLNVSSLNSSDPSWMDGVMNVAKVLSPTVTVAQFSAILREVILKNKDFDKA